MYCLDVDPEVRHHIESGFEGFSQLTRLNRCHSPMVDVDPVRCCWRQLVSIGRGEGLRDERPCVRVSGRFACKVPGIQFVEGSVEIVGIRNSTRAAIRSSAVDPPTKWIQCRTPRVPSGAASEVRNESRECRRSPRVAMTSDVTDRRVWRVLALGDQPHRGRTGYPHLPRCDDHRGHAIGQSLGPRRAIAGSEVCQRAIFCSTRHVSRRGAGRLNSSNLASAASMSSSSNSSQRLNSSPLTVRD